MRGRVGNEAAPAERGTVLVVDDEAPARAVFGRWIHGAGHDYLEADRVRRAIDVIETQKIDVVLADIWMPQATGLKLLRWVTERHPDVSVIMLTGISETRTAIEALTQGAVGYLIKPVQQEQLAAELERAICRRRRIQSAQRYTAQLESLVTEHEARVRRAQEEWISRFVFALGYRDEETGAHLRRTGLYCEVLAQARGWPPQAVSDVRLAAPLHDIGKMAVPDAVLRKPGRLTTEEYEVMKHHAAIGGLMLDGGEWSVMRMAREIALCHHEWWNGQGYPRGLRGTEIPESARLVAIADVYDALSHDRVYRPALPETEVLDIMRRGRETQFDPELFDLFLTVLPDFRRIAIDHPDEFEEAPVLHRGDECAEESRATLLVEATTA